MSRVLIFKRNIKLIANENCTKCTRKIPHSHFLVSEKRTRRIMRRKVSLTVYTKLDILAAVDNV